MKKNLLDLIEVHNSFLAHYKRLEEIVASHEADKEHRHWLAQQKIDGQRYLGELEEMIANWKV
jgi:hypothetical protein